MKKSFQWSLTVFAVMTFSSLYFAACHGDGGNGSVAGAVSGVPTFSKGVITAKGSITVNGVKFNTDNATIRANNGPGTEADLKVGKFVTVRGRSTNSTGTASNVDFSNIMTGPVSDISGDLTSDIDSRVTLTVFGQTIIADRDTVFEPADLDLASIGTGSIVDVSGHPDPDGLIHATFIESRPTATDFNIRGIVSNATGSSFELLLGKNGNPLTVLVSGNTTTSGIIDGQSVDVKIDPVTVTDPSSTSITAKSVTAETTIMPSENDIVFVEGFVTEMTGTAVAPNTFSIDGLAVNAGQFEVPAAGSHVMVHGRYTGGVVNADLIQLVGPLTITIGPISSVSTNTSGTAGKGNSIVVNGTTFNTASAVITNNARTATVSDLRPGKRVVVASPVISNLSTTVTGTDGALNSATTGTASHVMIFNNLQGPISAISGTISSGMTTTATVTVFGQPILINGNTKFDPALGSSGTGTLATFTTGSVIEVSGQQDGNGNILATQVSSAPTGTDYHILGLVSGVTGSPISSFTLAPSGEGHDIAVNLASGVIPTTTFADGEFVDIRIDPATVTAPFTSTTVTAYAVDVIGILGFLPGDKVNVEGMVSDVSGDTFLVGTVEIDASELPGGVPDEVSNGAIVRVQGTAESDSTIIAERIQIPNQAQTVQ